jgi:hypothetical protein
VKKQQLIDLGIDEETAKEIIILHGKDIEGIKGDLDTKDQTITDLTKQLDDANKTIEGFEGEDIEQLKKDKAEWQVKAEDFAKKLNTTKLTHAVTEALKKHKAINPEMAIKALKMDEYSLGEEGEIVGDFEDHVTKLKESDAYLFEQEPKDDNNGGNKPPTFVVGSKKTKVYGDTLTSAIKEGAGVK